MGFTALPKYGHVAVLICLVPGQAPLREGGPVMIAQSEVVLGALLTGVGSESNEASSD